MGEIKTSESVIFLPGDIVMTAYVDGDDGGARCKLCRYSDGTCTVGVTSQANVPIARAKKQSGEAAASSRASSLRPLSEMTGFETRRGLMLPRTGGRVDQQDYRKTPGGVKDTSTGEAFSKKQTKAYESYLRRHHVRNKVGKRADELVRIVDKYLPLQADETRAYVCRFPEQAEPLLKRVKKIRRRFRASSGADRGSTTQPSSTTAGKTAKKSKGGEKNPEMKTEVKAETLDEHAVGLMGEHVKKDRSRLADQRVKKDHATEDIPPDWGGSSDENVQ